jgi:uncharacterized HAD superfamily protein
MLIAIDLDGVLSDSMGLWIRIWNASNYPKLSYEDISEWDFWRRLGLTEERFSEIFDEVWSRWEELQPLEQDVAEIVDRISRVGVVDIVTGRPGRNRNFIVKWLRRHGINYRRLLIGVENKIKYLYDVYIDDSPIQALEASHAGRLLLLRDQPWNRHVEPNKFVIRIKSLEEAYRVLTSLSSIKH